MEMEGAEDAWNFGGEDQPPVLRADFNGDNLPLPKNSTRNGANQKTEQALVVLFAGFECGYQCV